ncbi:hypothetical protein [Brevibacterium luteolum]|uniref:hypothetical protein n=1 Tax=Brevibacterium luteolum TaxID=199591 RepID=UPI00223BE9FC|nr:hypothetical protein [Brevibacterium luteolum]MCT1657885.1 hypothetical protein [Brevibacterium luteolum]
MSAPRPVAESEWEDRLKRAIEARNLPVSVSDVLTVLADTVEPAAPLPAEERAFFAEHTCLTPVDLIPEGLADVDSEIAANRAVAAQRAERNALTVDDVARLLLLSTEGVRARAASGDLYAFTSHSRRNLLFPHWQFIDGRALPGLSQVMRALPEDYLPVDIEEFMTQPAESLEGQTPSEWLAADRPPSAVSSLADELSWE